MKHHLRPLVSVQIQLDDTRQFGELIFPCEDISNAPMAGNSALQIVG